MQHIQRACDLAGQMAMLCSLQERTITYKGQQCKKGTGTARSYGPFLANSVWRNHQCWE
jgi:hypothetical protein